MLNDVVNNQQQAPFCHMNVHKFHFINGSNPVPLLFIFVLFSTQLQMLCNIYCKWKKYWWCAWDLNPGLQDGSRRQIHWATVAVQSWKAWSNVVGNQYSTGNKLERLLIRKRVTVLIQTTKLNDVWRLRSLKNVKGRLSCFQIPTFENWNIFEQIRWILIFCPFSK